LSFWGPGEEEALCSVKSEITWFFLFSSSLSSLFSTSECHYCSIFETFDFGEQWWPKCFGLFVSPCAISRASGRKTILMTGEDDSDIERSIRVERPNLWELGVVVVGDLID